VYSGTLKAFNTIVQFLPSLLVARILKTAEALADFHASPTNIVDGSINIGTSILAKRQEGLVLSLLLLTVLCIKTIIENQYFHVVTRMGASIRGAVSSAVYRKSLRLSPAGRQNATVHLLITTKYIIIIPDFIE